MLDSTHEWLKMAKKIRLNNVIHFGNLIKNSKKNTTSSDFKKNGNILMQDKHY